MEVTVKQLYNTKRRIARRINKVIKPKLHDSGFVTGKIGESTVLQVCALPATKKQQKEGDKYGREVKGYTQIEAIYGFVEGGVITDCYMAIVVTPFTYLPLEDLLKLEKFVNKNKDLLV